MRVIIQNDRSRLYSRVDNAISARSKLNVEAVIGATSLTLINATDFKANDYLLLENLDNERAEITLINSLYGNTVYVAATKFAHDDKADVFKIEYNQARFYEDDTALGTVNLQPDYFTSYQKAVDTTKQYSVSYVNSITAAESPRGEKIYGSEYLLCGIGDVSQLESTETIGGKILDKIDIATRTVRAKLTNQKQDFTALSNPDVLRLPTAYLALHLYFVELIKGKDDVPSIKSKSYMEKYEAEIERATNLINAKEQTVKAFGQARCLR